MSMRIYIFVVLACFSALPGIAQQTRPLNAGASNVASVGESATVKPGDQIAVRIWMEPELSGTFLVSTSGEVILPRLGVVKVSDRSVVALQDSLRRAYSVYLKNASPEITVLRRIGVHGEVNKPGLYMVDLTMTLREVVAQAGGVTGAGDPNNITIVRSGKRIHFGQAQGAELLTAELVSGDQVAIGERSWFERNSLALVSTGAVVISLLVPIIREIF